MSYSTFSRSELPSGGARRSRVVRPSRALAAIFHDHGLVAHTYLRALQVRLALEELLAAGRQDGAGRASKVAAPPTADAPPVAEADVAAVPLVSVQRMPASARKEIRSRWWRAANLHELHRTAILEKRDPEAIAGLAERTRRHLLALICAFGFAPPQEVAPAALGLACLLPPEHQFYWLPRALFPPGEDGEPEGEVGAGLGEEAGGENPEDGAARAGAAEQAATGTGAVATLLLLLPWGGDPDRFYGTGEGQVETWTGLLARLLAARALPGGLLCNGASLRIVAASADGERARCCDIDLGHLYARGERPDFDLCFTLLQALLPAATGGSEGGSEPAGNLLRRLSEGSDACLTLLGAALREGAYRAVDLLTRALVARAREEAVHKTEHLLPEQTMGRTPRRRRHARGEESAGASLLVPLGPWPEERESQSAEQGAIDLRLQYERSLSLLFRLLFVLYAESRNLFSLQQPRYRHHYSLEAVRDELAALPPRLLRAPDGGIAHGRNYRIWRRLSSLFQLIEEGCALPDLVIPACKSRLFASSQHETTLPQLPDAVLKPVIVSIAMLPREASATRVLLGAAACEREVPPLLIDYRDLEVSQLGAVYETLLAYEPRIARGPMEEVRYGGRPLVLPTRLNRQDDGEPRHPVTRRIAPGECYLGRSGRRKSRGSYYTPPALVHFLVRRTLKPLVERCRRPEEIFEITVLDPAMGTGAFLVEACDYLTRAYVRLLAQLSFEAQGAAEQPPRLSLAEDDLRVYRRLIVSRCLYGVDRDALAVELAHLALWLSAQPRLSSEWQLGPYPPTPFSVPHLCCGDSLIGVPLPSRLYPDKALERAGIPVGTIAGLGTVARLGTGRAAAGVAPAPLREPGAALLQDDQVRRRLRYLADLWVAAWFLPAQPEIYGASGAFQSREQGAHGKDEDGGRAQEEENGPPEDESRQLCNFNLPLYERLALCQGSREEEIPVAMRADFRRVERLVRQLRPFHWQLEFPEIFLRADGSQRANAGFSAVLGNPPREIVKLQTRKFLATYDVERDEHGRLAGAEGRTQPLEERATASVWREHARLLEERERFLRQCGQYPAQSVPIAGQPGSDLNTYRLFLERAYALLQRGGYCGMVLPAGFYSDRGSSGLRRLLFREARIELLLSFENRRHLFPIDSRFKFALLVLARAEPREQIEAAFLLPDPAVLERPEQVLLSLPRALIERWAPETLSLLEVRTRRDVALTARLYDDRPLLGERRREGWRLELACEFDMTSERRLFNREGRGWPVYEGSTIHQYTHRYGEPDYHMLPEEGKALLVTSELQRLEETLDVLARERYPAVRRRRERLALLLREHGRTLPGAGELCLDVELPRLVFRRVASRSNERSLIATIVPASVFLGSTLAYVRPWQGPDPQELARLLQKRTPVWSWQTAYRPSLTPVQLACLCGLFNSLVLDYLIRHTISADITMTQVSQLPLVELEECAPYCRAIAERVACLVCVGKEFEDWRQQLAASGLSVQGVPFAAQETRQRLRCEIDALVARLYGLSTADLEYLLWAPHTFPLVEEEIKRGVMEAFARVEQMVDAAEHEKKGFDR
jgi:hypothetical protein